MSDIREQLKALPRPDPTTTKYTIEAELEHLATLITTHYLPWSEVAEQVRLAEERMVIEALNLLNTEPIHTVEQALIGHKERLEATLTPPVKGLT